MHATLTLQEQTDILQKTMNMCFKVSSVIRKQSKIKRNEFKFHHYVVAFAINGKYIAVHCPLVIFRKNINMSYQPIIQPINEDTYLEIISNNKNI